MPLKELRRKHYGKKSASARQAVNAEIRAEYPGGTETLEALELFHKIVRRVGETEPDGRTPTIAKLAYDRLCGISNAMEMSVREEWGMPPLSTGDEP